MVTTPDQLHVQLLGPVEVRRRGSSLRVGAAKQRAVLAALAIGVGRALSTDALIASTWGERCPQNPRKALQVLISELRAALGDDGTVVIASRSPGYMLDIHPENVDLFRFEALWEEARALVSAGELDRAVERFDGALALWRGPALEDVLGEGSLSLEAARLNELHLSCKVERIETLLGLGRHRTVLPELTELASSHRTREQLQAQLMVALYRCHRQTDALDVYRDTSRFLRDELGIAPSSLLSSIERRILTQDESLLAEGDPDGSRSGGQTAAPLLVISQGPSDIEPLTRLGAELAAPSGASEMIVVQVRRLDDEARGQATSDLSQQLAGCRDDLARRGVAVRVATLGSHRPSHDVGKLAVHQNAGLLLLDGSQPLSSGEFGLSDEIVWDVPADIGLAVGLDRDAASGPVLVPFGGDDNDWAALSLGANLATARGVELLTVGAADADGSAGRLLAVAALVVQRHFGWTPQQRLVPPGADGILAAASGGGPLIVGLSRQFRAHGIGATRHRLAEEAEAPVIFVHGAPNRDMLGGTASLTRFGWSSGPAAHGVVTEQ